MPTFTSPFHRRRTRREQAALEARRRWEHVRATAADRAEDLLDAAGDQIEHAREVATPKVQQMRKRAVTATTPVAERLREQASDAGHRLREEAIEASARASREIAKLTADVRDASRAEADRVIQAMYAQAEEARIKERRRRSRAVLGFTVFGMVAGALIYREVEARKAVEDEPVAALPVTADADADPTADELDLDDPTLRDGTVPGSDPAVSR